MPVGFLTDDQTRRYGRFTGDPTPDQLARHFHLDDADRAFVAGHRGDHNRLGVAVQLGSVRLLGTFLDDPADAPAPAVRYVADQLAIPGHAEAIAAYAASAGRWRHGNRIRERYRYRQLADAGVGFRLNRFLYALCWTGTDRPSTLFDRAVAWLVAAKVLLPGLSVLERAVARVRSRATGHLFRRLTSRLTTEQRARLDALVVVPDGARQSPLDRLREGPFIRSGPEIGRAVARLEEIRAIGAGLPEADRLPPGKVTALARFASTARAQAVARLPDDRRAATLLAFVRTLEASATDDVIDLFDAVSTAMFAQADAASREARLRSLRDLDAAALKLRDAGAVILDAATPDTDVRAAVLALVSRDALAAAVERVGRLAEPPDDTFFAELRKRSRTFRYVPALLRGLELEAAPAGKALLDAVAHLRVVQDGGKRPGPAPVAFAPKGWAGQLKTADGHRDLAGYRLAVLDGLRRAIRRRDVFPVRPLRYADPRKGLLAGAAWEAARPAVCRTVGVSPSADEELARLAARLDLAYRETAARVPGNPAVAIVSTPGGPDLSVGPLEKIEEPPSLAALRAAVDARLPRLDLPELHAGGACAHGLRRRVHPRQRGSRQGRRTSPPASAPCCSPRRATPASSRWSASTCRRSALAAELGEAELRPRRDADPRPTPALVAAQNESRWRGAGVAARWPRPTGCASSCRSARSTPGRTRATSAGARGHLLQPRLRPVHRPERHHRARHPARQPDPAWPSCWSSRPSCNRPRSCPTPAAYTDAIFGIFHLLGYQFCPRIADIGGARFWRVDGKADYGALDALAADRDQCAADRRALGRPAAPRRLAEARRRAAPAGSPARSRRTTGRRSSRVRSRSSGGW